MYRYLLYDGCSSVYAYKIKTRTEHDEHNILGIYCTVQIPILVCTPLMVNLYN